MLRLDRNPPSQLWGQHSAKACTAPTQSHAGPAAAGARARARCSSGPGGLTPASARGSRAHSLQLVCYRARACIKVEAANCSAWQGMYTIAESFLRSKTRQQLSNASCSFGRALLVMLPPRRPPAYWRRARGVGCCYVARTEQLKNASASLTAAAGPYSKLLLDTL